MTLEDLSGSPAPLTSGDIRAAAAVLGVSVAKVQAVKDVESRGRGFSADTGRPIILYEPHIFSRLTKGAFDASHAELSYPKWGTMPYPGPQSVRYALLGAAMALDTPAALKACSWGLFQIMGFNYPQAGFQSVETFVAAMVRGEGEQLMAFCRFVQANPAMAHALKLGDWAAFARLYNGPAYAQHGYDQRLKVAHARLQGRALA